MNFVLMLAILIKSNKCDDFTEAPVTDSVPPFNFPETDEDYETDSSLITEEISSSSTATNGIGFKILINGTVDEIKSIPKETIKNALWALDQIDMPLNKKLVIWNIIKDQSSIKEFGGLFLNKLGKIFLSIPELDLYNLNYKKSDVIDFVGTVEGVSRHRMGIIAYAIKNQWKFDRLENASYINQLKGAICGFPPYELNKITSTTFNQIHQNVFENLHSCTLRQLRVLYLKATQSTTYGPPSIWSINTTARLGLLLRAMTLAEIRLMRPASMEGLNWRTLNFLTLEHLSAFTNLQVMHLNDVSLTVYRQLTGWEISIALNCKPLLFMIISSTYLLREY